MLAYAFWHWPQPDVTPQAYGDALIAFHVALSDHAPAGFLASAVFRASPVPWMGAPDGGYLDWYLLSDSAALDGLNEAAVSPACGGAHDRAARLAAGGTAALYQHWAGETGAGGAR